MIALEPIISSDAALHDNNEVLQRNQRVSISSQQSTFTTQTAATTTNVEMRRHSRVGGMNGLYLRLDTVYRSIPWDRLKSIRWKNERARPGLAYQPTEVSVSLQNLYLPRYLLLSAIVFNS